MFILLKRFQAWGYVISNELTSTKLLDEINLRFLKIRRIWLQKKNYKIISRIHRLTTITIHNQLDNYDSTFI